MDTSRLRHAYAALLPAAVHGAQRAEETLSPPDGGWEADQILVRCGDFDLAA